MNSGVEPLLLQKNQCGFSVNATFREGYITDRPPYFLRPLNFGGDGEIDALFTTALFQGACYYKPDTGTETLMAAIGGRLFQFIPDAESNFNVFERTIPGNPNPPNITQAWLWQTENYVVWQDGQSFPVFFDGTSSRRSLSDQTLLGTTSANFVVPALGQTVNITLIGPFQGQLGQSVLINGATYQVVQPPGTSQATMNNTNDTVGTVYPIGTPIYINPNVFGSLSRTTTFAPGVYAAGTVIAGEVFNLSGTLPVIPNGTIVSIEDSVGFSFQFQIMANQAGVIYPGTTGYSVKLMVGMFGPISFLQGTDVINTATSSPSVVVATLALPFTAPVIGASSNATLQTDYTGPAGQPVIMGTAQYTITAVPAPPPGLNLTIRNINDTPAANVAAPADLLSVPEIGPGRMGAYGLGRNWYSLTDGRTFRATDIVGGPSGSIQFNFRDSVLKETENIYMAGGGDFVVPGSVGSITSITFPATLDSSLGQGAVQIGTPTTMFSCNAPVERAQWQVITSPILTQSLKGQGPLGQNSTINVNSDIIFRSNFGEASLILARREFDTWGNTPISQEMRRVLSKDNRALLQFASAIDFDNRILMTATPTQGPQGVYFRSIVALNTDLISSLRGKAPSIYDGQWTGLNVLQLVAGKFNGVDRGFAFVWNSALGKIELYELMPTGPEHFDNATVPILWGFETPVFLRDGGDKKRMFKFLEDGEISVKNIAGRVDFRVQYRSDSDPCWRDWHQWSICAARNNPLSLNTPNPDLQEQYRPAMAFGRPDKGCDETVDKQLRAGYWFQARVLIQGHCRVISMRFMASEQPEPRFLKPICGDEDVQTGDCPECRVLSCRMPDDTSQFTITAGTVYQNTATIVTVDAAPGTFLVPDDVIKLYVSTEPVSPLRLLGCECEIVRSIDGKTAAEIAVIAQDMVDAAVQQYARCRTSGPTEFFNSLICTNLCPQGLLVNVNAPQSLPSGIFLQSGLLCVASGTFQSSVSNADANDMAQLFINNLLQTLLDADEALCGFWNAEQIVTCPDDSTITIAAYTYFSTVSQADADAQAVAAGEAECPSTASCTGLDTNQYAISGYVDGQIDNSVGNPPVGGEVVWDGTYIYKDNAPLHPCRWMASFDANPTQLLMDSNILCDSWMEFTGTKWTLQFLSGGVIDWEGEKLAGTTPAGVYTQTGGPAAFPVTITIVSIGGAITLQSQNSGCEPV